MYLLTNLDLEMNRFELLPFIIGDRGNQLLDARHSDLAVRLHKLRHYEADKLLGE